MAESTRRHAKGKGEAESVNSERPACPAEQGSKWSRRTQAVVGKAHSGVQMHRGEQAEVTMTLWKAECKREVLLVCMTVSENLDCDI